MKSARWLLVASTFAVSVLVPANVTSAQRKQRLMVVQIHNGIGTGQTFRELTKVERLAYAGGFMNGVLVSPLYGAPRERMKWFESCTEGMTAEQVAEIILRYVNEHPAEWHHQLNTLSHNAIAAACRSPQVR